MTRLDAALRAAVRAGMKRDDVIDHLDAVLLEERAAAEVRAQRAYQRAAARARIPKPDATVRRGTRSRTLSRADLRRALDAHRAGATWATLAERLGVHPTTLAARCRGLETTT